MMPKFISRCCTQIVLALTFAPLSLSAFAGESHYVLMPAARGESPSPMSLVRIENNQITATTPLGATVGYGHGDAQWFGTITEHDGVCDATIWDVATGKARSTRHVESVIPLALMEGPGPQVVIHDHGQRMLFVCMSRSVTPPDAFMGLCMTGGGNADAVNFPTPITAPRRGPDLYLVEVAGGAVAYGPGSTGAIVHYFDVATKQYTAASTLESREKCVWVPKEGLLAWTESGHIRRLADSKMNFLPKDGQSIVTIGSDVMDLEACEWDGAPALSMAVLVGGNGFPTADRVRVTDLTGKVLFEQRTPFQFLQLRPGHAPKTLLFITSDGEFATFDAGGKFQKVMLPNTGRSRMNLIKIIR